MGLQHLLHHLSFPKGAGSPQSNPIHSGLKGIDDACEDFIRVGGSWGDGVWGVGCGVWGVVLPSALCPLPPALPKAWERKAVDTR